MKRMKKIMAVLLAAIMTMAMAVTAFAVEGASGTNTLTVNVKDGQNLNGQTINLYKLFDVTESGTTESKNYAYTVNETYKKTLATVLNIAETSKDEDFAAAVTKLGSDNATGVQNFANTFTTKALEEKLAATATSGKITEENKTSYTFNNLAAGYYLVYVTGGKEIQSSLVTVDADTNTVNLKTEAPSITKTADKETVSIGQVVKYTVTGSIPDTTGYAEYVYKIHDELSTGLDFVNDAAGTALEEGATTVTVQAGVGHFWGTSLPVGGESTHTVLTGHRGLPTKTLFTNMDKLEVGDIFYIKVLDETLAYQIDQILTVLPQETDSLSIEPGKDYATLVTCTPFAINTHRLLVRGERIPYEEATKQEPDTNIKPELSFTAKVLIVTIIVIFIGLMIAIIYSIRDRKRRKVR